MDAGTYYLIGVIVGGVLAIANAVRGAMLMNAGERQSGTKYMLIAAAMLLLTTILLLTKTS